MAQGEGFKHIAVTPADEEDVVFQAGVVRDGDSTSAGGGAQEAEPPVEEPELPAQEAEPPADEAELLVEEPELPAEPPAKLPVESSQVVKAQAGRTSAGKKDAYRETTLEDLQSTSMPLAQKIVIIAAVVCIIGAVVYYFAFIG